MADTEGGNEDFGMKGIPTIAKPDMENLRKLTDSMDYRVGLLTRDLGLSSGILSRTMEGVIYGAIFAIVLIGVPIVLKLLL